jgi:hypothetical protein
VESNPGQKRPTESNQMPWIVITCGNKDNEPHGRIVVAEFFDSRFPNAGHALPRTDMHANESDEFKWDFYRLDMGKPILIPPKKPGEDPIAAREHKSALKNWDKPDGFYIQCPKRIAKEGWAGIALKPCKKRTLIRREDWTEFGMRLIESGVLVEGGSPYFLAWDELMPIITSIQNARNRNQKRS